MKLLILTFGGVLGALGVVFGAFGAHLLKRKLSVDQLKSYETGVKYQIYHALLLIILAFNIPFIDTLSILMGWCIILGVFLFSFSIYGLVLTGAYGNKMKWLGPVTPLGGLLLVIGWILFIVQVTGQAGYL